MKTKKAWKPQAGWKCRESIDVKGMQMKALALALTLGMTACSKEEAEPQVDAAAPEVIKVTSSDGIEVIEQPSMTQSVEPSRNLQMSEPVQLQGDDKTVFTPPVENGTAPSPGGVDGNDLKMQEHLKPQTPSMRLEVRNQAMAEMLRVRKEQPQDALPPKK